MLYVGDPELRPMAHWLDALKAQLGVLAVVKGTQPSVIYIRGSISVINLEYFLIFSLKKRRASGNEHLLFGPLTSSRTNPIFGVAGSHQQSV